MAGYGVYTVYGQRYPESRSINPYHAVSTEQAQSAKDLSYGKRLSLRLIAGNPEQKT